MKSIVISLAIASLALAQAAPAPAPKPDATVTLKKLTETRELSLEKSPFSGWNNGMELSLHIDGPAVVGARKFGKLHATEAVDDAGTDLTKKGEGPKHESKDFREVREPQSFGFQRQGEAQTKPTGFDVDLGLPTPSARSAKSLKHVAGSLEVLVGGEKKIVQVKPVKANLGKAVDDPALKSLGVTFTLIDPTKRPVGGRGLGALLGGGAGDKGVSAEIAGNIDAIAEVKIVDPAGKKLTSSSMWHDDPGKRSITYELEKPLSDDAILEIEVWPGQKTVTVPFELKDIALP